MRQAPQFLIIGSGRMATHFCHYLDLLSIPFQQWSRDQNLNLKKHIQNSTHIFILISDGAIQEFIQKNINPYLNNQKNKSNKILIHFSGCLSIPEAIGAHPLYTFSNNLYNLNIYQNIPFFIEKKSNSPKLLFKNLLFKDLIPGLPNPSFYIHSKDKPYYHALCVMANNFTTLIWTKFFDELKSKFGADVKAIFPIAKQTFENLKADYKSSLTGPFARNDLETVQKNLNSLSQNKDPFQYIYQGFIDAFLNIKY